MLRSLIAFPLFAALTATFVSAQGGQTWFVHITITLVDSSQQLGFISAVIRPHHALKRLLVAVRSFD